jgi:glutaredoxin
MDICSSGHHEIVFDSRHCPYCEDIEKYDEEVRDLKAELLSLREENEKLEEYNQKLLFFRGQKEN